MISDADKYTLDVYAELSKPIGPDELRRYARLALRKEGNESGQ